MFIQRQTHFALPHLWSSRHPLRSQGSIWLSFPGPSTALSFPLYLVLPWHPPSPRKLASFTPIHLLAQSPSYVRFKSCVPDTSLYMTMTPTSRSFDPRIQLPPQCCPGRFLGNHVATRVAILYDYVGILSTSMRRTASLLNTVRIFGG